MTHEAGIEAASDAYMDGEPDFYLADRVSEIIQAYLSASGMVLVPRDPTEEMIFSAWDRDTNIPVFGDQFYTAAYHDMLEAAPDPFKSKP